MLEGRKIASRTDAHLVLNFLAYNIDRAVMPEMVALIWCIMPEKFALFGCTLAEAREIARFQLIRRTAPEN